MTARGSDALWAAEGCVKTHGIGAVLLWADRIGSVAVRRLQAVAQNSQAAVFLLRPERVRGQSSPAPYRVTCRAAVESHRPGLTLEVEVIKRRGVAPRSGTHVHVGLDLARWQNMPHDDAVQCEALYEIGETLTAVQ